MGRPLTLALALLMSTKLIGCSGAEKEPTPDQGLPADAMVDALVDAPTNLCDRKCPQNVPDKPICLSGRVFEAVSLFKNSPAEATPIGPDAGAEVKIYDWYKYMSNPTGTEPLAMTPIYNDHGCFIVDQIAVPIGGFLGITVDDASTNDTDDYAATITRVPKIECHNQFKPCPYPYGEGLENIEVPAIHMWRAWYWSNGLHDHGSMLMWFRAQSGKNVADISPTQDGICLPWEGSEAFYFNDDLSGFDGLAKSKDRTTTSGLVAIRNAPVKHYSGARMGCTVASVTGGSAPHAFHIYGIDVEGCD